MNTSIPSRARSFVSAILALSLGFSTTALALRAQTPYENGATWLGRQCWDNGGSDTDKTLCCARGCDLLYHGTTNNGAFIDCYHGCLSKLKWIDEQPNVA